MAVRAGKAPSAPGLVARCIARDGWSVYCRRAYAERFGAPKTATDLADHQVTSLSKEYPRTPPPRLVESIVPPSAILARHHNVPGLFTSLRGGLGVSMMPDLVASTEPHLHPLLRPPEAESVFDVWLVTTERFGNEPRIRAQMDFLAV